MSLSALELGRRQHHYPAASRPACCVKRRRIPPSRASQLRAARGRIASDAHVGSGQDDFLLNLSRSANPCWSTVRRDRDDDHREMTRCQLVLERALPRRRLRRGGASDVETCNAYQHRKQRADGHPMNRVRTPYRSYKLAARRSQVTSSAFAATAVAAMRASYTAPPVTS